MLTSVLDLLQYSCGGSIGSVEDDDDDSDSIYSVFFVRKNFNCTSPIEVTYYSAKYPNICYHCGVNNVAEKSVITTPFVTIVLGIRNRRLKGEQIKIKRSRTMYNIYL